MKIGEALRKKRLELGLTQQEMCEGILSRPFYAKVESGKNRINVESLFKILFARQIDLVEFGKLVQGTYDSAENTAEKRYQSQMNVAVSTKDLKLMEKYCQDIIESSNDSAALAVYMVEFSRSQYLTLDLSAINLGGQLQNIVGPMIFGESAASNSLAPLSMCVLTLSFTVIELRRILSLCRKK